MSQSALDALGVTQQQIEQLTENQVLEMISTLRNTHNMRGETWCRWDIQSILEHDDSFPELDDEEQAHVINEVMDSRAWRYLCEDDTGQESRYYTINDAVVEAIRTVVPDKPFDY